MTTDLETLARRTVKYLSICSGIEAASVAWHDLQWQAVGFSEIEPFPCAVLSHRYPATPNFGDMTRHADWNIKPGSVDLVVGGTPCQSFSVAGLRAGMADPRGNLALTFLSICNRLRPEWIVWENVPGVLSSNGGRDFGSFLGALAELGYGFAYRVLDAQHFGVAQRRRRVFVVANATDWRRAAAVLFEPESLRGNPAPSRAKGQVAAAGTAGRAHTVGTICADSHPSSYSGQDAYTGRLIPAVLVPPAPAIPIQDGRGLDKGQNGLGIGSEGDPSYTLDTMGAASVAAPAPLAFTQNSREEVRLLGDLSGSLPASSGSHLTTYAAIPLPAPEPFVKAKRAQSAEDDETWEAGRPAPTLSVFDNGDTRATVAIVTPAPTLTASNNPSRSPQSSEVTAQVAAVYSASFAVRRLTPVECERLQGFPDDWTAINYRGKPAADGPRYKAIGNSMAVPVMRWIGERIDAIDKATKVQS